MRGAAWASAPLAIPHATGIVRGRDRAKYELALIRNAADLAGARGARTGTVRDGPRAKPRRENA